MNAYVQELDCCNEASFREQEIQRGNIKTRFESFGVNLKYTVTDRSLTSGFLLASEWAFRPAIMC